MLSRVRINSAVFAICLTVFLSGCDELREFMGLNKLPDEVIEEGLENRDFGSIPTPGSDNSLGNQNQPRDLLQEMLIDPPEGEWPEPLPSLVWLDSLAAGWEFARQENRPVFVLVHCPGTLHPGRFDERILAPIPDLADVLRQFVTVELTDGGQIDLARMPFEVYQDPDQTWWCWVLSPQGHVYSVLGPAHPTADNLSERELVEWLTSILDYHCDPRRPDWKTDLAAVSAEAPPVSITGNPGFNKWKSGTEYLGNLRAAGNCLCCHQVQDVFWCAEDAVKKFRANEDYWLWPPVEKIGFHLDREAIPELSAVEPDSMGTKLDFKTSDRVGVIRHKRVFSATDVRAAIQELAHPHIPKQDGDEYFQLVRLGEVQRRNLTTAGVVWTNYDVLWRKSIKESVLASHPGFLVERAKADQRRKLNLYDSMAFLTKLGQQSPAWEAGLRLDNLIVRCGPRGEDFTPEQFYFFYKMNLPVGGRADLTIRYGEGWGAVRKLQIPAISVLDLPPEAIQIIKELERQPH